MPRQDITPQILNLIQLYGTFPVYYVRMDFDTPVFLNSTDYDMERVPGSGETYVGVGLTVSGFEQTALDGSPSVTFPDTGAILNYVALQGLDKDCRIYLGWLEDPKQTAPASAQSILIFRGKAVSVVADDGPIITFGLKRETVSKLVPITRMGPPTNNHDIASGTRIVWGTGEIIVE